MELINKILIEASYEKDNQRNEQINEIIDKLEMSFYNYSGKNSSNFFYKNDIGALFKLDNLSIFLYEKKNSERQSGAEYNKNSNTIYLYGCEFSWDNEKNSWNYFYFNKNSLYHELVHYFDYQNIENDNYEKVKINGNFTEDDYKKYLNHGTEFNAHFMQYIMPIVNDIKTYKNRRYDINSFNDFKKEILTPYVKQYFYDLLNDKMKKHLIKRIAEYYQKIF